MNTLYLCGAGNSEGVRLAQTINQHYGRWQRIVLLDDDPGKHGQSKLGVEIAGPFARLAEADPVRDEVANLVARTTAGRSAARRKIAAYGLPFCSLISPDVETTGAVLGQDITVYHNATIGPEVFIGEASVVFMGAVIGHEARMDRCCVVASNAVLNARVHLAEGVYVGSNATILPEVEVGSWATIGAGSMVMEDVPAGATAVGVPAQVFLPIRNDSSSTTGQAQMNLQNQESPRWSDTDSDLERTIANVWQETLHVSTFGWSENFFDVGGNSLLAIQLCQRMEKVLGHQIALVDVFGFPTVRSLARHIGVRTSDSAALSPAQRRAQFRRRAFMSSQS